MPRRSVFYLLGLGVVVILVVRLASLSHKSPLPQILFWHSMTGGKATLLRVIIANYNTALAQNQAPYRVQLQFVGNYQEGLNKLRTSLIVGHGPAVAQITDIGSSLLMDSPHIVPLEDFMDRDSTFSKKDLIPSIRRYYEKYQKLYSLPFSTSNPVLYYNKDWFDQAGISKPPEDFYSLIAIARQLTRQAEGKTGIIWPLTSWFFEEYLALQGALLADHANGRQGLASTVYLDSPEGIRFVKMWKALVDQGLFLNVGRGWDPAEHNFLSGRCAMLISSTAEVFEMKTRAPFHIATAFLPTLGPPNKRLGTVVGGNSLWILKNQPRLHQEWSYALIKYMASHEVQKQWHTHTGYFPIRLDVINELKKDGFYAHNPHMFTAIEQMLASPESPATSGALLASFPEIRENIQLAIEQVLNNRDTVESALKKARWESEKTLNRYNQFHR